MESKNLTQNTISAYLFTIKQFNSKYNSESWEYIFASLLCIIWVINSIDSPIVSNILKALCNLQKSWLVNEDLNSLHPIFELSLAKIKQVLLLFSIVKLIGVPVSYSL